MKKAIFIILTAIVTMATMPSYADKIKSIGAVKISGETTEKVAAKVTKGVTTKEQIRLFYDTPSATASNASGNEVWVYTLTEKRKGIIKTKEIDKTEITFVFDKNGIVSDYTAVTAQVGKK